MQVASRIHHWRRAGGARSVCGNGGINGSAATGPALDEATRAGAERHLDALQLVDFKLGQLAHHLAASSRVLNDLTMLRRVLIRDGDESAEGAPEP